ncbi:MAG: glycosyltransferase [Candidatus Brocadia sp.]|nr:glycosyltransferase [Candidatus Brocadia sp.]
MKNEEKDLPKVSIVIIGRNEAENLKNCIHSILNMNYPQELLEVIYVDTNSNDGSPEIAKSLGIKVCEEYSNTPSPALARNRGWKETKYDVVHFVDGDTVIYPNYLLEAIGYLGKNHTACVFGKLNEKNKKTNWISNLLHTDWKIKKVGFVASPGAGGTFLKSALSKVGGYNSKIRAGEEPDIGIRLRREGYQIRLIDSYMCMHDYGLNTIGSLLKRYFFWGMNMSNLLLIPDVPWEIKKGFYKVPLQCGMVLFVFLLLLFKGYILFSLLLFISLPLLIASYVLIKKRRWIFSMGKMDLSVFLYFYFFMIMKPLFLSGQIYYLIKMGINKIR